MILLLLLTVTVATGELPLNCRCYLPTNQTRTCITRGCNNGTRVHLMTSNFVKHGTPLPPPGSVFHAYTINKLSVINYNNYVGGSCPNLDFYFGYYLDFVSAGCCSITNSPYPYHYNTCTEFGSLARDMKGNMPADANNALKSL